MYVILRVVDNLKTILAPILPHTPVRSTGHRSCTSTWATRDSSSARSTWSSTRKRQSHRALTYDHTGAIGTWAKSELRPGQALRQPAPLFKKLDESVIEEEYARLKG